MKRIAILTVSFVAINISLFAVTQKPLNVDILIKAYAQNVDESLLEKMDIDKFLNLTPKSYKTITGKKLGFLDRIKLKWVQKRIRKITESDVEAVNSPLVPQWVYIILSLFFMGWLVMGLSDDWFGSNWWICLLLYIGGAIFLNVWGGLAGFIFALVKMNEYY